MKSTFEYLLDTFKSIFYDKRTIVLFSAFLLIILWGYHGDLDLLSLVISDWSPPGVNLCCRKPILPFVPWDRELISFWGGGILLVLIPMCIIKFHFKEPFSKFGLGWPPKAQQKEALFIFLLLAVIGFLPMVSAAENKGMQEVYPFYRLFKPGAYLEFALYELSYFPFFIAIEFIFRGYILFGMADAVNIETQSKGTNFNPIIIPILIAILPYTTWHLGKPLLELWGTPLWGVLAGACAYRIKSIWPGTFVHWSINVFLDAMILHNTQILF